MAYLNRIEIIGNVGKEPEMRFTPNGIPVASFTCAVNKNYTRTDGEKIQITEWFNVVCWRKLAETVNQFVTKGMMVYCSGSASLHRWTTREGEGRSNLQIDAVMVLFLSKTSPDTDTDTELVIENSDDEEPPKEIQPDEIPY